MQKLLPLLVVLTTCASAQAPKASSSKSDWTRVQVLQMGTQVHIKTLDHGSIHCAVAAVDAESITCGGVPFKRSSIQYIKGRHKLRSTIVGFGVGYGSAAAISTAYAESCKLNCRIGTAAGIGVLDLGLVIATPIVFGVTDLTAGTIYNAP